MVVVAAVISFSAFRSPSPVMASAVSLVFSSAVSADQLQIGRVYQLQFTHTAGAAGEQNRDAIADRMQLTGAAILSDIQINAQNTEVATYTARFTGTGELEPYSE